MRPVLPFATPWVIDDDLLLLDDGSSLGVCDQPCMQGAEVGVGWAGVKEATALQALSADGGKQG